MRQIESEQLWIGHIGDARDFRALHTVGVVALVDLAGSELPLTPPREMVYCRFPLIDGAENPAWLLQSAVAAGVGLVRRQIPTLIFCSAGMSRSVVIAAAALSVAKNTRLEDELKCIANVGSADVSPALWHDVKAAIASCAIE